MSETKRNPFGLYDRNCDKYGRFDQKGEYQIAVSNEQRGCIEPFNCHDEDRYRGKGAKVNAATGGAGPLPVIGAGAMNEAIPIVSVTVSPGREDDSSVLLNFTTLISIPAVAGVAVTATLGFEVVRIDGRGGHIKVGPLFVYKTTAIALETNSFAFQLFDRGIKSGTYTYSVLLSTITMTTSAGISLINSTLSTVAC